MTLALSCLVIVGVWRVAPVPGWPAFDEAMPHDCLLVGVELSHPGHGPLPAYARPERAIYQLGAEDNGLSKEALTNCH